MSRARLLTIVVLAAAVLYGIFGGEYGTFDWLELRRQERAEQREIARLRVEVDSLERFSRRLKTDRRLLEQLAREHFGMIRPGEFLYRIEGDSLDAE